MVEKSQGNLGSKPADGFGEHVGASDNDYVRLVVGEDGEVHVVDDHGNVVETGTQVPDPVEGLEEAEEPELLVPLNEMTQRMKTIFARIHHFSGKVKELNVRNLEEFELGLTDLIMEIYEVNVAGLLSIDPDQNSFKVKTFEVRIPGDSTDEETQMLQDLKTTLSGKEFTREDKLPDYLKRVFAVLDHKGGNQDALSQAIGTPDKKGIDVWLPLKHDGITKGLIFADDHRAAHELSSMAVLGNMPLEDYIAHLWSIAKSYGELSKSMEEAEEALGNVMVKLSSSRS